MRSVWVEDHLSPSLALAAADDALERARTLPPEDFRSVGDIVTPQNVATVAAVTRARARWYLGEISPARHDLFEHLEAGDTSPLSRLHLFGGLALVESWNGVLTLAEHFGAQAHEIANQSLVAGHPYLAPTELALAHVALERGDTVVAAARLDAAARLMEIVSHSTWTTMLALERAWLALVEGRPREGIAVLAAESPFRPLFDGRRRALRARLLLALDDVAAAERALAYDPATANSAVAAVAAQLALTRGHQALARRVVDQWPRERSEQDHLAHCFWVAVVALAVGQEGVALSAAAEAVEVGAAGGHVRAFLDAGAVATPLLQLLGRHDATGHMAAVLAAHDGDRSSVVDDTGDSLLTPRERVVLRHLADRLTYAEIADELFISRNTVKTHAKSVYMKLGANGRRDAIQRAEQHGLL
jgi:LuxR family transcriptional regulator, maltose regulon positive regulatory protein